MSAFNARRDEDVAKLKSLEQLTAGRIRITQVSGSPVSQIQLKLTVRTAGDDTFPSSALREVDATIQLGARYPFEEPAVSISTKVFNPNVYTSGRVCLGSKWLATEYLDLLAQRLFKILAFDESILNTSSAANGEAARWYIRARLKHPADFPTDALTVAGAKPSSSVRWTDMSGAPPTPADRRIIVPCPKCQTKLRLPKGRSGDVSCPACKHSFSVNT
jgi:ubiquitin-protein ligase